MFGHLRAIPRHIRRIVIHPAHPPVAELDVILIAEFLRHAVPELHQRVVNFIEFLRMLRKKRPARGLGAVAHVAVQALLVGGQAREVDDFALDLDFRGGE